MTKAHNLRVVVAEDDEINLFIVSKTLKDAGHVAIEFPDGDVAWEYLSQNFANVDMVILDKMMHHMSGIEVVRRMKEHDSLKNIPVIIQSGDVDPEKIRQAVNDGVDCYITKPFEDFQLLDVINEIVEKNRQKVLEEGA